MWHASVAAFATAEAPLRALLDAAEHERCALFHFDADRTRYAIAHGLLRLLVGHYVGMAAGALRFAEGEFGKPALAPGTARPVSFNLSHSGDLVLIAIAQSGDVGVDVERWSDRLDTDLLRLAEFAFSTAEHAAVRACDAASRRALFFDVWARKEAYIKARGHSVAAGLAHFDVPAEPGDPRPVTDRSRTADEAPWWLHDLAPGDGYSAALAVDRPGVRVIALAATPALVPAMMAPADG
ncbi:MAG: 4'-phosphopantetheinyl transferase superfamily protein [bacterium]